MRGDRVRDAVEPTVVCQLLEGESRERDPLVWLPLRANGEEIGALVGAGGPIARVDPVQLDTAAVLAAHVAASLDAALALRRERESAVTDPLTGVLNRRGLEERLERELASAKERRTPMSLLVIDCDDLKEINDRLGHRNFADFVNSRRIEAAKQVLADPAQARTTVAAIAYELGFASLGPFNRAFKAQTGLSPREWRNGQAMAEPAGAAE